MIEMPTSGDFLQNFREHVIDAWFPKCMDPRGGFVQNFDPKWTAQDDGVRSLVYQARHTWVASKAMDALPDRRTEMRRYADHGLRFLMDRLHDEDNGGFQWSIRVDGTPVDAKEPKHAYGIAFAIYALAAHARATHSSESLGLARQTFAWLDENAHDPVNGGYFEVLTDSGSPADDDGSTLAKMVGPGIGFRSSNTHMHLLEAFTELYKAEPDNLLASRIEEIHRIMLTKMYVRPGSLHENYTNSWQPVPGPDSYGHNVEAGFLMLEAAETLGRIEDEASMVAARALVDNSLRIAVDPLNGSLASDGTPFGRIHNAQRIWWVQAEFLNALAFFHHKLGSSAPQYGGALTKLWGFIISYQVDTTHKGWIPYLTPDLNAVAGRGKSDGWTEGYHQSRALLNCANWLLGS